MKRLFSIVAFVICAFILSSCATIFGGAKYWAKVQVPSHPNAVIEYKGIVQGNGEATFKAKRSEADQFSVTIKEDGCNPETKNFTQKSFRGWAFVGSLVGWTGMYEGIPLPWGIVVDAATGAIWKPDINEKGVTKQDFDHFIYTIEYTGCPTKASSIMKNDSQMDYKIEKLKQLKKLLDDGVITNEEFESEKKKVLEQE